MKVVIDIPEIPKNDKQRWALANGTPYPHGEWEQVTAKDGEYYCYHKCTNCGQTIESGFDNPPIFNFCPNCGADMRKEGEKNGKETT